MMGLVPEGWSSPHPTECECEGTGSISSPTSVRTIGAVGSAHRGPLLVVQLLICMVNSHNVVGCTSLNMWASKSMARYVPNGQHQRLCMEYPPVAMPLLLDQECLKGSLMRGCLLQEIMKIMKQRELLHHWQWLPHD